MNGIPSPQLRLLRSAARLALVAAFALTAGPAWAADRLLPFGVEGHGRLQLAVPEGWRVDVRPAPDRLPATTLTLGPRDGAGVVMITAMAPPKGPLSAEALRKGVEASAAQLQRDAVEEQLRVETRSAPPTELAFVSATDRRWAEVAPPEGEWRHVTTGAASSGGLVLSFTVLTNGGDGRFRARALDVVSSARHLALGAAGSKLLVSAAGATLSADLPGLEVLRVEVWSDRGGARVMGALPDGYAVTLTLEAAPSVASAAEAREARWAGRTATEATEDARRSSRGEMALLEYLIPRAAGREIRQRHVHGYLHRGGAVGEVHLSKVLYAPEDDAALGRLLDSVRLE